MSILAFSELPSSLFFFFLEINSLEVMHVHVGVFLLTMEFLIIVSFPCDHIGEM